MKRIVLLLFFEDIILLGMAQSWFEMDMKLHQNRHQNKFLQISKGAADAENCAEESYFTQILDHFDNKSTVTWNQMDSNNDIARQLPPGASSMKRKYNIITKKLHIRNVIGEVVAHVPKDDDATRVCSFNFGGFLAEEVHIQNVIPQITVEDLIKLNNNDASSDTFPEECNTRHGNFMAIEESFEDQEFMDPPQKKLRTDDLSIDDKSESGAENPIIDHPLSQEAADNKANSVPKDFVYGNFDSMNSEKNECKCVNSSHDSAAQNLVPAASDTSPSVCEILEESDDDKILHLGTFSKNP